MPRSSGSRGPYAKSAARRKEILDSALVVFAEKGFEGTSLTAIGEAVGVTREALRHYFASREELLLAVIEARDSRSRELAQETAPDTPLLRGVEDAAERQRGDKGLVALYASLVATSLHSSPKAREYFTERFTRLRAELTELIELSQERGEVRGDVPPSLVAAMIVALSDGLQQQWLLDDDVDVAEGFRLLERLLAP